MKTLTILAALAVLPLTAHAQDSTLAVADAYVTSANPKTGATFMILSNTGDTDCTLIGATGTVAEVIELHGHFDDDGVMKMRPIEGGITVPAGGSHALERGGDHVMLMGVGTPLKDGDPVALTLDFGDCGTLPVEAVVDNAHEAAPAMQPAMQHDATMQHGSDAPAN